MALSKPVHDATDGLVVEVAGNTAFELLIGLYAADGDAGERWLHLLGIPLDTGAADAASLVDAVEALDPLELRRHLVGVHVPAWRQLVGPDALEAAARGGTGLLAHPRYYAGRAAAALTELLPLGAEETKTWILDRLRATPEPDVATQLASEVAQKRALKIAPEQLIDVAAGGYRYEREPELERVVLVPHFAARPWLLLCQHRTSRVICYPVADDETDAERLVAIGRALGDEKRVAILLRLRRGDATLQELADETGLARSTAHHHVAQLRRARLIALRGNAQGYAYTLDAEGIASAGQMVTTLG
jgi:DNA-binding transcriptional ArsR family regulator